MTISDELKAIIDAIPEDFADPSADYHAVRRAFAPFHGHSVGDDFSVEITEFGGVSCGHYDLRGATSDLLSFHCHGGAFVSCPLAVYHFYAEIIATQVGCRVVMPDYRLAPEHPYPAAHDDCFHAYRGLLESGADPGRIVVMGESCGGLLALGMLLRARDEGLPMPLCFVSLTGWFDLSVKASPEPAQDPFLTAQWVRNRGRDYTQDQVALDDPRLSPAHADLQGLPPLYLQVGEFDTVREGAIELACNAARCGVSATMESWPGMIQGWHGLVNANVPEAASAWRAIKRFVETAAAE